MATIIEYVEQEAASFDEKPLGEVDALVLAQLSMIDFAPPAPRAQLDAGAASRALSWTRRRLLRLPARGVRFSDLRADDFPEGAFNGLTSEKTRTLLAAAIASPRFGELSVHSCASSFSEQQTTQFAATAFSFGRAFTYLAFRGTDASFTGWREDFDMAVRPAVPAQAIAARYASSVSRAVPGALLFGGHSKGGNLAVYAAAKADARTRSRIEVVYDFDGPGLREETLPTAEYDATAGIVRKIVPRESLVGLLLERRADYRVVKSTAHGIDQHSPFTWVVDGSSFAFLDGLAPTARFVADVLNEWIASMTPEETVLATDALFKALESSGAENAAEILLSGPKLVSYLATAARKTSRTSRRVIARGLREITAIAARRAGDSLASLFGRDS